MCNFNRNINLYLFDSSNNNIELTNLSLHYDENLESEKMELSNELTLNFVNENTFLPLKFSHQSGPIFNFGLFDSKNFMHLVNIGNFNHVIMYVNKSIQTNESSKINSNENIYKSNSSSNISSQNNEESLEDIVNSEDNNIKDCINNFDNNFKILNK